MLTAGHCIYDFEAASGGSIIIGEGVGNNNSNHSSGNSSGEWIRSWMFSPGWNGVRAPYGVFSSRTAVVPPELIDERNPSYDIGVVVLTNNVPVAVGPFFELEELPHLNASDSGGCVSCHNSNNSVISSDSSDRSLSVGKDTTVEDGRDTHGGDSSGKGGCGDDSGGGGSPEYRVSCSHNKTSKQLMSM